MLGNNMFAYCRNDPVCRVDVSGSVDMDCFGEVDDEIDVTPGEDDLGYSGTGGEISYTTYVYSSPFSSYCTSTGSETYKYTTSSNTDSTTSSSYGTNPYSNITYTPKVMAQMSNTSDPYHAFPSIIDSYIPYGSSSTLIGGDGVMREYISFPGSINGTDGFFEYILEPDGTCNHRLFRPY